MSAWVSLSRAIAHPSSFGQAGRTTHVETVCPFSTAGSVSRTRMPEFRAQVITNRWDQRYTAMHEHLTKDGRLKRAWEPRLMNTNPEGESPAET